MIAGNVLIIAVALGWFWIMTHPGAWKNPHEESHQNLQVKGNKWAEARKETV